MLCTNLTILYSNKSYFVLKLFLLNNPPIKTVSSKVTFTDVRSFVYENTVCQIKECCIDYEIPGYVDELQRLLNENVFGQHIAIDVVVNALKAHLDEETKVKKALTLSFHGLPGSGKNYVANFIAESLYRNGLQSNFVHYFVGRRDFELEGSFLQNKHNIYDWIVGNLTLCPKQLFIFDEVDKMPPGVLNSIKPLMDFRQSEHSIFIFISNTAEYSINEITNHLWKSGVKRTNLRLEDFENRISKQAFNEDGGFHHSDTVSGSMIDYFVPFLPLEVVHVKQCIVQEFKKRNVLNPTKEDIYYFLNMMEWNSSGNFAKSGCKRIPQKVASYVKKHYQKLKAP